MKTSKIFAGISAMAVMAAMSIPAFAGNGGPITVPNDSWQGDQTTLAKRMVIGAENDKPYFKTNNDAAWEKAMKATTVKLELTGDYFLAEDTGWGADGSIVITGTTTNWGQHDFGLADNSRDEDGNDKNADNGVTVSHDGTTWTVEFTDAAGLYNKETPSDTGYIGIAVQNFNEDTTHGFTIVSAKLFDKDGNEIIDLNGSEGDAPAPSDTESKAGGDSSKSGSAGASGSKSTSGSTGSGSTGSSSTGSSSSGSSKSGSTSSDGSAATGAASGLALAGIALAGAAFVVSKKK